jgi:elongation factor G
MLFDAGAVNRLGRVEEGNTVTDFDADEISRQISLATALAHCEWNKTKLNLLDTPGYGNFIQEARVAIHVADAALVNVCGVAGVEVQTEKVWSFAEESARARFLVVNRLDRDRSSFSRALESIQKAFGRTAVPVQLPVGEEKDFRGVIDLVRMKAYLGKGDEKGTHEEKDVPAEMKEEAEAARSALVEMVAEVDDALMEKYLETGALSPEEFLTGLKLSVLSGKVFPVLAVSGTRNLAVRPLMDALVDLTPAPEPGEVEGRIERKARGRKISRRPAPPISRPSPTPSREGSASSGS